MSHRRAAARLRLNASLVREQDRARARELKRLLVYGALLVVPLLAYVWQRVEFIRRSYEVEALKKERQSLTDLNRQLIVERSHLLAPDRIEAVARRQLGLVDPLPDDVRRVMLIDGRLRTSGSRADARRRTPRDGAGIVAAGAGVALPSAPGEAR